MAKRRWIASSTYEIRWSKTPIVVRLAELIPDDGPYKCFYEIGGLRDGDLSGYVFGADGIQSLYLAMKRVAFCLERSTEFQRRLFKIKPDGYLGLPGFDASEDD